MKPQKKDVPHIFVDKVKVIGPCIHSPVGQGWYVADSDTGEIVPVAAGAELHTLDQYSSPMYIQSKGIRSDGKATHLLIHACPPSALQRHNLFGHSNVREYVYQLFKLCVKKAGIEVQPEDKSAWRDGRVKITEIHLTANFYCPQQAISAVIDAIDQNNRSGKHRNTDNQIGLGYNGMRRSKYHVLSIYNKYLQLLAEFGSNPGRTRKKLLEVALNALRVEVKVFSQYLKRNNLNLVAAWSDIDVARLYFEFLEKYRIRYAVQQTLTNDEISLLTIREANVYHLWLSGKNVSDQFKSRTTVNAYVESIKAKVGIDIKSHRRPEALPSLDLEEIFSISNVIDVPRWLKESNYYVAPDV